MLNVQSKDEKLQSFIDVEGRKPIFTLCKVLFNISFIL